jgi:sugar phosphate isomerase/epimerase
MDKNYHFFPYIHPKSNKSTIYMASRRQFITKSVLGLGAASLSWPAGARTLGPLKEVPFEFGLASYTLRKFDLEQTIEMTRRVGLKNLCLKSMHLPLNSSSAQLKSAQDKIDNSGMHLYGCGVVYMKNQEQVDQAFEYAKHAGMSTIVGVPEHDLLPYVDEKVKAYNIKVAIHNHGPGDEKYPSAESIYTRVKDLDPRIGICIDIGHTVRIGLDPTADVKRFKDRLHDVHIKDVDAAKPEGETLEIGRGIIDIPRFLSALIKIDYNGVVSFEYEKDADDPLAGLAESVGYVRGVIDTL